MMQNILVSSLTPLQNVDEFNSWENRPFSGIWPQSSHEKLPEIKRSIKKKPKRIRTAYTTEQLRALEHLFTQNKYITAECRRDISKNLNIGDKSVKIWFQNRRMKEKRVFSESSSDSSNETLVSELSPPFVDKKSQNSESVATKANMEHFYTPQSHVGNYTNNEHFDNSYASGNMTLTTNNTQFYNNNNMYPIQYYPYNENNLNGYNYNYFQYQQDNEMYNSYLSSSNVESSYFYN